MRCKQGRQFVIKDEFFPRKKVQTYRISDHTLVRHVCVGAGPMSVMFRAVDPDIRVSMIKQEMFKFWEGTIYVQDLNATGAPTCTIILCSLHCKNTGVKLKAKDEKSVR